MCVCVCRVSWKWELIETKQNNNIIIISLKSAKCVLLIWFFSFTLNFSHFIISWILKDIYFISFLDKKRSVNDNRLSRAQEFYPHSNRCNQEIYFVSCSYLQKREFIWNWSINCEYCNFIFRLREKCNTQTKTKEKHHISIDILSIIHEIFIENLFYVRVKL